MSEAAGARRGGGEARGRALTATDAWMLFVVLVWGANFSVVKVALAEFTPLAFTALRFAAASLLLAAVVYAREGSLAPPPGTLLRLVGLGLVGNFVYQLLFIVGLSRTTAANSALLVATTPVLVALLGGLLGVERVTRHVAGGVGLAFAGIVLVLAARGLALSLGTLGGDLMVLGASACWAVYTLGVRSLAERLSPLRLTALTMIAGTPGLVAVGLPELLGGGWPRPSAAAWGGFAYATLFALVAAYLIWNASVRAVGGSRTAVYSTLIPLVAVLVAWPLLGERPAPLQAVGAALIVAGLLLTRRRPRAAPADEAAIHVSS